MAWYAIGGLLVCAPGGGSAITDGQQGGGTEFLFMNPSPYTPSTTPAPSSFLVAIGGGAPVSTPAIVDASGNYNFNLNISALYGTGPTYAYVYPVDSSGNPGEASGPYNFSA